MSSTTYNRYYYDQRVYPILLARNGKNQANRATRRAERRNAGQLPQPFWLGAARGGCSHSLSASVARA